MGDERYNQAQRFLGVTFFIGYTEKGVTREARQRVDEEILWDQARRGGSQAVREFLHNYVVPELIEGLLRDFLAEFVQQEKEQAEREKLFGKGPLTVASMENAIAELVKKRRDDPPSV